MFLKFSQKMVHSICDGYPKFGAAQPLQTGVITRREKWGRGVYPSPASRVLIVDSLLYGLVSLTAGQFNLFFR